MQRPISRGGRGEGVSPTSWWDDLYRRSDVTELPWYSPSLDPDIRSAVEGHVPSAARILDLGTGPATHAIELARQGYRVIGTDIAPAAIEKARAAARRAGVWIDFRVDNILDSRLEANLVDAVVDRGMFHVLPPTSRPRYVRTVHRVLRPGGLLFLKTFSDKEPGDMGPYRFSPGELRSYFRDRFDLESLEDTVFHGRADPGPQSLLAVFRRR